MIDPTPWAARVRPGPRAKAPVLTPAQREAVEAMIRPAKAEKRIVKRGEALLLLAAGVAVDDVARLVGIHERTATEWRKRFTETTDPVSKLRDAPRPGRPRSLSRTRTRRG